MVRQLLRQLLAHSASDPGADGNAALRSAVSNYNAIAIEVLLWDLRVDPTGAAIGPIGILSIVSPSAICDQQATVQRLLQAAQYLDRDIAAAQAEADADREVAVVAGPGAAARCSLDSQVVGCGDTTTPANPGRLLSLMRRRAHVGAQLQIARARCAALRMALLQPAMMRTQLQPHQASMWHEGLSTAAQPQPGVAGPLFADVNAHRGSPLQLIAWQRRRWLILARWRDLNPPLRYNCRAASLNLPCTDGCEKVFPLAFSRLARWHRLVLVIDERTDLLQ